MKVYTLLKQLENPVKPMIIRGKHGSLLFKGILNNVPWHIAKCEIIDTWESVDDTTCVTIK